MNRKELIKVLTEWWQKIHEGDTIGFIYDIQDIVTEDGIGLVAKISPSQLHRDGPDAITKELGEMVEWGSRCHRYDFLVCFRNGLYFFKTFISFGIDHDPHVPHVHMTYVYSLSYVFTHDHMAKRSHYRIMIFYRLQEFYSTDASPPSFSSSSSTTPPPLYSPSMSINDGPTWRRIPPSREV